MRTAPWPDVTGGYRYLGLDRMAYYVNKDAYRSAVRRSGSRSSRSLETCRRSVAVAS